MSNYIPDSGNDFLSLPEKRGGWAEGAEAQYKSLVEGTQLSCVTQDLENTARRAVGLKTVSQSSEASALHPERLGFLETHQLKQHIAAN